MHVTDFEKPNSFSRPTRYARLHRVGVGILIVGMLGAVLIYFTAADQEEDAIVSVKLTEKSASLTHMFAHRKGDPSGPLGDFLKGLGAS